MQARFIGDPADNGSGLPQVELYGVTFLKGVWTDVPDDVAAKLKVHSHFAVDKPAKAQADAATKAEAKAAEAAAADAATKADGGGA